MDSWQLDFEWLRIQHLVKDSMNRDKLPDLQAILFLIGIQELGQLRKDFSKEEKQDLMHIAVCTLLSQQGYYEIVGKDEDGWPHFKLIRPLPEHGAKSQEKLLKEMIILYFQAQQLQNGPIGSTN